jgi:amidase
VGAGTDTDVWRLDAVRLAALIREGALSAREAVASTLARIDAVNPTVNALTRVLHAEALAAADTADTARRAGAAFGPLHGVPVTVKINTDQAGQPNDNGVAALRGLIAPGDNPVVSNLRAAGAIIVGRSNSPALAFRAFTDNRLHGLTRNPWNAAHNCGGSSGGAGVAVATGMGPIAQGNDIGGSIRGPAFCNGVIGLRPTIGRVPSFNPSAPGGRTLAAQTMSAQGPLARTVADTRLAYEAMAVRDMRDNRWTPVPLRLDAPRTPVRVALVPEPPGGPTAPAVAEAVRRAGRHLAAAGHEVEECTAPELEATIACWFKLVSTEQWHTMRPKLGLVDDPDFARVLDFFFEMYPPLELPDYLAAWTERDALLARWTAFFEERPIVIMPVCTERPLPVGLDAKDLEGSRRARTANRCMYVAPLLGIPGLALPIGMDGDLPLGVQLYGARWREDLLLDAAAAIEAGEGVRRPIDPRLS